MSETEETGTQAVDAYVYGDTSVREAPVGLWTRLKYLGPAVIISGSIVGSGELILTSTLGAAAGFVLFWWVILACASKSIVQAELTRYVIVSGDTYLRALNRLPGTLPGPDGPVAWPIWLQLVMFFPSVIGIGGIMGGAGEALSLLVPFIDPIWGTVAVAVATILILTFGNYSRLESIMMLLVGTFTLVTIFSAVSLQFTPMALDSSDIAIAFSFDFPLEYLALALAVYGFTGVNAGEIGPYTYWCVEKGYPAYIGPDSSERGWLDRAQGWIRVVQMDVLLTLLIVICATIPFYVLGAGVLHAEGRTPDGLNVVSVLSGMFTDTLGEWAYWLFVTGAFSILFSTAIAGVAGGARVATDVLTAGGFIKRSNLALRRKFVLGYGILGPLVGLVFYLYVPSPVILITFAAMVGALMLPVQSGATLWLQAKRMDPRVRPGWVANGLLRIIFIFQCIMALLVIWFVVF